MKRKHFDRVAIDGSFGRLVAKGGRYIGERFAIDVFLVGFTNYLRNAAEQPYGAILGGIRAFFDITAAVRRVKGGSQFAQPRIDRRALVNGHRLKLYTYAKKAEAIPGMHVDRFAAELAGVYAIGYAKVERRVDGNRFEGMDITATRAQFRKLSENRGAVAQSRFRIRENLEARIGTPFRKGSLGHGAIPLREGRCPNDCMNEERHIETHVPRVAERGMGSQRPAARGVVSGRPYKAQFKNPHARKG